jgi:pyridinium-3,5-biscarboxylic acid mononucleotide sulfurtransferase
MQSTFDPILLQKRLEGWFAKIKNALIALSGGIDSSLVAYVARKQLGKDNVVAIISASASVKKKELNDARNFCSKYDITLNEIDSNEIANDNYRANPLNRCFFCKSALYSELNKLLSSHYAGYSILNGNNFSDMHDYRPGLKAADNYEVLSPLAECEFTKEDIRNLAHFYGLPIWNKPASPCLSSRFPYGEAITVEKLKMVERAEDLLNEQGFEDVRVRFIKNSARIEVPSAEIDKLQKIYPTLEPSILSVGFSTCEIDPEGLVSGKLNREIG